jgi:hypothetical protein
MSENQAESMRKILVIIFFIVIGFSFAQTGSCDKSPVKNKKIIEFLKTKIGKNIGKMDLIVSSYKYAGIKYNDNWLGNDIDAAEDCVYPGDLIVFKSCNVNWKLKDTTFMMSYGCHVEYIIYKVKGKGAYQVVVQLEDDSGKRTATLLDYSPKDFVNGERPDFLGLMGIN